MKTKILHRNFFATLFAVFAIYFAGAQPNSVMLINQTPYPVWLNIELGEKPDCAQYNNPCYFTSSTPLLLPGNSTYVLKSCTGAPIHELCISINAIKDTNPFSGCFPQSNTHTNNFVNCCMSNDPWNFSFMTSNGCGPFQVARTASSWKIF